MSTSHAFQTMAGTTVTTTTETVIATVVIPSENQPLGSDGVEIAGTVMGTAGAGTTAVSARVRIGSVTGTIVGNVATNSVTASVPFATGFDVLDTQTSYPAGQTYVVTLQQTGATGNALGVNACGTTVPCTPLTG